MAPTWDNLLSGQQNLIDTNARTLKFTEGNKEYKFNENVATLIVRPRGWHLEEKHVIIDNEPMSGSLFDFGVYFFHNYELRKQKGLGGCFYYLPKLEAYQEARLWNDVFITVIHKSLKKIIKLYTIDTKILQSTCWNHKMYCLN